MTIDIDKVFTALFLLTIVHCPYFSAMESQKIYRAALYGQQADNDERVALYFGNDDQQPLVISSSELALFSGLNGNIRDAADDQSETKRIWDGTKKENNIIISGGLGKPFITDELFTIRWAIEFFLKMHRRKEVATSLFTGKKVRTLISVADFLGFDLRKEKTFDQHINWDNLYNFYLKHAKDQDFETFPELFHNKCQKAQQRHIRTQSQALQDTYTYAHDQKMLQDIRNLATFFLSNTLKYKEKITEIKDTTGCFRRLCLTEDGTLLVALAWQAPRSNSGSTVKMLFPYVFIKNKNTWEQCLLIQEKMVTENLLDIAISGDGNYLAIAFDCPGKLEVHKIDRSSHPPQLGDLIFETDLDTKDLAWVPTNEGIAWPSFLWVDHSAHKILARMGDTLFTILKNPTLDDQKETFRVETEYFQQQEPSLEIYMNFHGSHIRVDKKGDKIVLKIHAEPYTTTMKLFGADSRAKLSSISMGKKTEKFLAVYEGVARILPTQCRVYRPQAVEEVEKIVDRIEVGQISNDGRYAVLVRTSKNSAETINSIIVRDCDLKIPLTRTVPSSFFLQDEATCCCLETDKKLKTIVASWSTPNKIPTIYSCFIKKKTKNLLKARTCSVMDYILNLVASENDKPKLALLSKAISNPKGNRPVNISSIYPGLPPWMQEMVDQNLSCRKGWGPRATYALCKNQHVPWYYKAEAIVPYALGAAAVGTTAYLAYKQLTAE